MCFSSTAPPRDVACQFSPKHGPIPSLRLSPLSASFPFLPFHLLSFLSLKSSQVQVAYVKIGDFRHLTRYLILTIGSLCLFHCERLPVPYATFLAPGDKRKHTAHVHQQAASQASTDSATDIGREFGGCASLAEGDLGPHLTQCGQTEAYLHAKFHLDPSNRLATIH